MSALGHALEGYLKMRRDFGYKLASQEARLWTFVRFMAEREATVITAKLAIDWAGSSCGAPTWSSRLSTVRSFARHVANSDPLTEIPPKNVFPPQRRPKPYIFGDDEVENLLAAARDWPSQYGFQRLSLHCIFGLLVVTGLRSSEAINLKRDDVDLCNSLLHIRDSKFGKSRLVPLDQTTVDALSTYVEQREAHVATRSSPYFLVGDRGARLRHDSIHRVFMNWSQQAGLRQRGKRGGPRLHDLRHSFAVRTLLRWYRANEDVDRLMPMLSTYLGHTHTRDTYWYLTAIPELMGHAAAKLERHWEVVE